MDFNCFKKSNDFTCFKDVKSLNLNGFRFQVPPNHLRSDCAWSRRAESQQLDRRIFGIR